jgi:ribosomal protein L29
MAAQGGPVRPAGARRDRGSGRLPVRGAAISCLLAGAVLSCAQGAALRSAPEGCSAAACARGAGAGPAGGAVLRLRGGKTGGIKARDIWSKPLDELSQMEEDLRMELMSLRVAQQVGGQPGRVNQIKKVRKSIARVLTVATAKRRAEAYERVKNDKFKPLDARKNRNMPKAMRQRLNKFERTRMSNKAVRCLRLKIWGAGVRPMRRVVQSDELEPVSLPAQRAGVCSRAPASRAAMPVCVGPDARLCVRTVGALALGAHGRACCATLTRVHTHTHTRTHAHTRTHMRAHARTRAHAHAFGCSASLHLLILWRVRKQTRPSCPPEMRLSTRAGVHRRDPSG